MAPGPGRVGRRAEPVAARGLVLLDPAGQPARGGADNRVGVIGPGRAILVSPPGAAPWRFPCLRRPRLPRRAAGIDAQMGGDRHHDGLEALAPRDDLVPAPPIGGGRGLPGAETCGPPPRRLPPAPPPAIPIAAARPHETPAPLRASWRLALPRLAQPRL